MEIVLEGYVNRFGQRSRSIYAKASTPGAPGPFVEQIQRGAFQKSIRALHNIVLEVDHDRSIGSVRSGELQLIEDDIGLKATARIRDREVITAAKRGLLRGWSFTFVSRRNRWDRIGADLYRRTVTECYLNGVSLMVNNTPSYPGTTVNLVEVVYDECNRS